MSGAASKIRLLSTCGRLCAQYPPRSLGFYVQHALPSLPSACLSLARANLQWKESIREKNRFVKHSLPLHDDLRILLTPCHLRNLKGSETHKLSWPKSGLSIQAPFYYKAARRTNVRPFRFRECQPFKFRGGLSEVPPPRGCPQIASCAIFQGQDLRSSRRRRTHEVPNASG